MAWGQLQGENDVILIILLFSIALSLSISAGIYGVLGLISIFPTAPIQIGIMGGLLEIAKLIVASWLYRNWNEVPLLLKAYFIPALIILMLLTSIGIYGGLSKAHLDQAIPSGDIQSKVELIEEKINYQRELINETRNEINQLDSQINRYTELGSVTRGIKAREAQRKERTELQAEIEKAQTEIEQLNQEKYSINSELRAIEAEVGPIKYIAALIYGDNPSVDLLEKAVRFVIILIVLVFDPLAVLMLIGANWSLKNRKIDDKVSKEVTEEKQQSPQTNQTKPEETFELPQYLKEPVSWTPSKPMVAETKPLEKSTKNEKHLQYDSHGRLMTPKK